MARQHGARRGEAASWATLRALGQAGAGGSARPIRVSRAVCLIGAHPRVHLPLRSAKVSRVHALIVVDEAETYVRDLASRNGVFVDGRRVREARLLNGDLLSIGPCALRWSIAASRRHPLARSTPYPEAVLSVVGEALPRRMAGRTMLIGCRDECDMVLADSMVATVHALIYRREGRHFIRDLNSKTGTYVNSRKVRETPLQRGDEIRIGLTFIRFEQWAGEWIGARPPASRDGGQALTGLAGMLLADRPTAPVPIARAPTIDEMLGPLQPGEEFALPGSSDFERIELLPIDAGDPDARLH